MVTHEFLGPFCPTLVTCLVPEALRLPVVGVLLPTLAAGLWCPFFMIEECDPFFQSHLRDLGNLQSPLLVVWLILQWL